MWVRGLGGWCVGEGTGRVVCGWYVDEEVCMGGVWVRKCAWVVCG